RIAVSGSKGRMTTSVSDCPMTAFCSGAWSEGCMTDLGHLLAGETSPWLNGSWKQYGTAARYREHFAYRAGPLCGASVVQQRFLRNAPQKWGHRMNVRCPSWVKMSRATHFVGTADLPQ